MTKYIDLDFETRSEAKILIVGTWVYAEHPSTKALIMRYSYDNKPTIGWRFTDGPPKKLFRLLKKGYQIRAHNSFFEYCIWNFVCVPQLGWPPLDFKRFECTQAQTRCYSFQPSLEVAGEQMGLPVTKDKEGKRLIQKFSVPRRAKTGGKWNEPEDHPVEFNRFDDYCEVDVLTQKAIADYLPPLTPYEKKVFWLTEKMSIRGVPIDEEMAKSAIKIKEIYLKKANKRVNKLSKGKIDSATQRQAVKDWLKKNGLDLPDMKADTIERVLKHSKMNDKCRKMLVLRQNSSKSSTAKYVKALEQLGNDGRIHGTLKYHAARTGRWGGQGFQVQNLKRPSLFKKTDWDFVCQLITDMDVEGLEIVYGDIMEVLSSAVRSSIKAPKGKRFISADYAQIEARVSLWMADIQSALDIFRTGGDVYCDMATSIYKRPITKDDEDERFIGKQVVLGLGYGMGWKKFKKDMFEKFDVVITNEFAKSVVKIYREKYKDIVALWKETETAAINAVKNPGKSFKCADGKITYKVKGDFLYCYCPSGHKITYHKPKIAKARPHWGGNKLVEKLTYMGWDSYKNKWLRLDTYGGKLLENYVQAISYNIMCNGMLRAEKKGYEQIFTVHDEAIAEVNESFGSVKEYEDILCELPTWAKGIPIVAEGWEGYRYRK